MPLLVRRPGVKEPFSMNVKPDRSLGRLLHRREQPEHHELRRIARRGSSRSAIRCFPARRPTGPSRRFRSGDKIVQIDDGPIDNLRPNRARNWRGGRIGRSPSGGGRPEARRRRQAGAGSDLPVARKPMRELGLVMKMGEITAVQAGSPAVAAGIKPGDLIRKVDGSPVADPMTPARLNSPHARRKDGRADDPAGRREDAGDRVGAAARSRSRLLSLRYHSLRPPWRSPR